MNIKAFQKAKVLGGFVLALIVVGYLIKTGFNDQMLILTGILGGLLGWIIGILFSPKDQQQSRRFSEYKAGFGAFLGGAVAAKAEQYIWPYISNAGQAVDNPVTYLMYFLISFCIGLLFTWVGRNADELF